MMELEDKAKAIFREKFGHEPDVGAFAPGRVNLIGYKTNFTLLLSVYFSILLKK